MGYNRISHGQFKWCSPAVRLPSLKKPNEWNERLYESHGVFHTQRPIFAQFHYSTIIKFQVDMSCEREDKKGGKIRFICPVRIGFHQEGNNSFHPFSMFHANVHIVHIFFVENLVLEPKNWEMFQTKQILCMGWME